MNYIILKQWKLYIVFVSFVSIITTLLSLITTNQHLINCLDNIDYFVCLNFFLDFIYHLKNSENKRKYLMTIGLIDIIASIPVVSSFRLLKIIPLVRDLKSVEQILQFIFRNKISTSLLFSFFIFVSSILLSSVLVLHFEHESSEANIKTIGEALWWSINLASTCGNTTLQPVTLNGRITACVLMILGYGLFSMNAGILTTWFLKSLKKL